MRFQDKRIFSKYIFIVLAIAIAISFLIVSNRIATNLADEERQKVELWADALYMATSGESESDLNLALKILSGNKTIPVILCDDEGKILMTINIDLPQKDSTEFLNKKIESFRRTNIPIVIQNPDFTQHIYYGDSSTLRRLQSYPFWQIIILSIFVCVSFLALLSIKNSEQNKVWVGLSKETAHQLGTPISSLMAWVEYLKENSDKISVVNELEKDVLRLQVVADRFSKIGSKPAPELQEIRSQLFQTVSYMEKRISPKVKFSFDMPDTPVYAKISMSLFSWVIENLTKNAVDAMEGKGKMLFAMSDKNDTIYIDISDTGKGMPKSMFKQIFMPGYTTKERGWGLGLSLAKRIIEDYHKGKIYVKQSELGVGTTFTIELKKEYNETASNEEKTEDM